MARLQGEFVPVHAVGEPIHEAAVQLPKVDDPPALAESVPVAALGLSDSSHVNGLVAGLVTVWDAEAVVVPPHFATSLLF
jgi:hypothetical protein